MNTLNEKQNYIKELAGRIAKTELQIKLGEVKAEMGQRWINADKRAMYKTFPAFFSEYKELGV